MGIVENWGTALCTPGAYCTTSAAVVESGVVVEPLPSLFSAILCHMLQKVWHMLQKMCCSAVAPPDIGNMCD